MEVDNFYSYRTDGAFFLHSIRFLIVIFRIYYLNQNWEVMCQMCCNTCPRAVLIEHGLSQHLQIELVSGSIGL